MVFQLPAKVFGQDQLYNRHQPYLKFDMSGRGHTLAATEMHVFMAFKELRPWVNRKAGGGLGKTREGGFTVWSAGRCFYILKTAWDTECLPIPSSHVNVTACLSVKDWNRAKCRCPSSRMKTRLGSLLTELHWT